MKKIFTTLILLAFTLIITSCGPNSEYYDLGSNTYYYYVNEPLVIDPYDFIREYNSWIGLSNPIVRKNPQNYYDVTVEYREQGSKAGYKEFKLDENSMIFFEKPNTEIGNNTTYEFKIHFLDKETKNEKEMINYYGVFTFKRSPAYLEKKVVNLKLNDTYHLLNNVIEYEGEEQLTPSDLITKYDSISYKVEIDGKEVTVTKGEVTLDKVGTYSVTLTLELTIASADGGSGASPSAGGDAASGASPGQGGNQDKMVLVMNYTINVKE